MAERPRLVAGQAWRAGDRTQLTVVSISHAIQHCYPAVLGIAYPFALADFHASYAVLGVILGLSGLGGNVLQALAGWVRRAPAGTLLSLQNFGLAVATAAGALSPGILVFGLARVLATLVSWPQHPVGSAHLTDRVPHRRGFVLAIHTTGGNVGTLIGPLIASAIIAAFNWRWALGGLTVLMLFGWFLTATRMPGAPHQPDASDPGPGPVAGSDGRAPATQAPLTLARALRRRKAAAVIAAGIISAAGRGIGVLTTYLPAYLRDALHEPTLTIGMLVTVVSVGAIGGPLLGGQLSDRIGRRLVLYVLYAGGAAGLSAYVLAGSSTVALALLGLLVGVFSYSEQPVRQALFSDAMHGVPARAAFGAYFAISQSIGALWITVLGFVVTYVSFRAAFFLMAASFVVAGAVIAIFARDP